MSKTSIFGRTRALERRIDEFLDKISETALIVEKAIHESMDVGEENIDRRVGQVMELKRASSGLRREIESELYSEMLIPDLLGDVASLIETLHALEEEMHHKMRFSRYGRTEPPDFVKEDAKSLVSSVARTIDNLVGASRAFFRDFQQVRDYVHKVSFHESECDEMRDRLLKKIYGSELDLALQDHLATSVRELDGIADSAERIADSLTIYAIKRAE
jgi:predicted phosphate transport protein (TIGR00153 family)